MSGDQPFYPRAAAKAMREPPVQRVIRCRREPDAYSTCGGSVWEVRLDSETGQLLGHYRDTMFAGNFMWDMIPAGFAPRYGEMRLERIDAPPPFDGQRYIPDEDGFSRYPTDEEKRLDQWERVRRGIAGQLALLDFQMEDDPD